jgi:Protein of unknown function (DUF1573)
MTTPRGFWLGFIAATAFAGCTPTVTGVPDGPPRIHFSDTQIDLGAIASTENSREACFPFQNRGSSVLKIQALVKSCTCISARAEPEVVEPGGAGSIFVDVDTAEMGARSTRLNVYSNDANTGPVTLRLDWLVEPPVSVDPDPLDFGTLAAGTVARAELRVRQTRDAPNGRVSQVSGFPDGVLEATLEPLDPADPKTQVVRVTLTASAPKYQGEIHHGGKVQLQFEGSENRLGVPVKWRIGDLIELRPPTLFAGAEPAGKTCEQWFSIVSNSGRLEVDDLTVDPPLPELALESERIGEREVLVAMRWTLPETPGRLSANIQVRCRTPEQRDLLLPISAFVLTREDRHDNE